MVLSGTDESIRNSLIVPADEGMPNDGKACNAVFISFREWDKDPVRVESPKYAAKTDFLLTVVSFLMNVKSFKMCCCSYTHYFILTYLFSACSCCNG